MYDITWLLRGAQSAVFYYASCAPYTRRRNRRRRAKEVEQDRVAQQAMEQSMPGIYRQPSPYRHNEYWEEDIRLGPSRSERRKGKAGKPSKANKVQPQKRPEMSATPSINTGDETFDQVSADTDLDNRLSAGSHSAAHMAESAMGGVRNFVRSATESGKQRWNAIRQQREDEELWGFEYRSANQSSVRQGDYSSKASSVRKPSASLSRYPTVSKTGSSTESFFAAPRAPPVNDLHPPIISTPALSRTANRWMIQPPPPPSVMAGYHSSSDKLRSQGAQTPSAHSLRSRSGSIRRTESHLKRQLSNRIVEEKLRSAEEAAMSGTAKPPQQAAADPTRLTVPQQARRPQTSDNSGRTSSTVIHRHRRRSSTDSEVDVEPRTPDSAVGLTVAQRDFAFDAGHVGPRIVPLLDSGHHSKRDRPHRTNTADDTGNRLHKRGPSHANRFNEGRQAVNNEADDELNDMEPLERRWSVDF